MKIAVIGVGHLGSAIVSGILAKGLATFAELTLIERNESSRAELSQKYPGCATDWASVSKSECIISCVRPQDFSQMAKQLVVYLGAQQLVLSVMAGASLEFIAGCLNGHAQLVRSMPNLPAKVGLSMTPYIVGANCSKANAKIALTILESFGVAEKLDNEAAINAATAVSGSGPGFFFAFSAAMVNAACEVGFSEVQANRLVKQTLLGAANLLNDPDSDASKLRENMRLKGGTTEAGYGALEKDHALEKVISKAVNLAFDRATQLAKG